jgi:hypothetical protein
LQKVREGVVVKPIPVEIKETSPSPLASAASAT